MPERLDHFVNQQIYHVYNKTIDDRKLFGNPRFAEWFLRLSRYYRSSNATLRYSYFRRLPDTMKIEKMEQIDDPKSYIIDILQFCLMPNHFHFLLRQRSENGIPIFMADLMNALTRFYNTVNKRKGPLFLTQFRSKRITTVEYLTEISRYIHLNPHNAGITRSVSALIEYPYSSLVAYIGDNDCEHILNVETETVLREFNNNRVRYFRFLTSSLHTSEV